MAEPSQKRTDRRNRLERFGRELAAALATRGLTQRELGEALGGTRQSAVSSWCSGQAEPNPATVFGIERALELPPGRLSRHLGYLPVGGDRGVDGDVERAIAGDPFLDPVEKRGMLAMYTELVSRRSRGKG